MVCIFSENEAAQLKKLCLLKKLLDAISKAGTVTYNNTLNLMMVRVVISRATRVPCLSFFLSTCCDKIKQF